MMKQTEFLSDNNGAVITAYHGTYYDFDYFFPLTHFGTEYAAKRVLNEGKWKRDKNIDINKPKIIPVNFKKGNYVEIPDLNNHYVEDWKAIILALLLDKTIIDDINKQAKWELIEQKCHTAAKKSLPYQYDFICEHVETKKIQRELALESLYDKSTEENLFLQRMILFLESIGIDGFKYPNFTECGGQNSYIVFRQNNVIRLDKKLAPMIVHNNIKKLHDIESTFVRAYKPRFLSSSEIELWIKKLRDFYDFKMAEIAKARHKTELCNQLR